ncbi:MAG: segregation/condensation protein A [Candidatus Doudnabacteria bacterium]|nr:segregation/condensation protein A [bacterium]MDZ4244115.1 segregation/condensation protein A [Candidatus Doudnabacteria bacterium]
MKVKVHQFEGPLDLLLRLIEEEKLDITEISLASVTEQFLQYMRSQTNIAPGELADWLVIAAKLLVIKSRILVPSLKLDEGEEQDAVGLAWQLYQYKKYKETAKYLHSLDAKRRQGWSRHLTFVEKITFFPDPNASPSVLRDAMRSLAKTLEEIIRLPEKVLEEVVTISEKIDALQKLIYEKVELKLRDLLKSAKSKTEVIVTFLALLELVKQKILSVEQETIFSEIFIKKKT